MDLQMNQHQHQVQKTIFNQSMQQAIKILQLSAIELGKYLNEEAYENPLLDIEPSYESLDETEQLEKKIEWLNSIEEERGTDYRVDSNDMNTFKPVIYDEQISLAAHLKEQLDMMVLPRDTYRLALYMIYLLNEHGYLESGIDTIAEDTDMSLSAVEDALKVVQTLEPIGVGARSVEECLLLQFEHNNCKDENLIMLVRDHFDLVRKNQLSSITKVMHITMVEVKRMMNQIRALNLYPGSIYTEVNSQQYVIPDVVVAKFDDYYEVLLNDVSCPKVHISGFYKKALENSESEEVKKYINTKMKQAMWVVSSIEQRNSTVKKVAVAIVKHQKKYFDDGPGNIVPMNLEVIAQEIDMNASTVSRAIHDKYIQCIWGVFDMKIFFANKMPTASGIDTTPELVKDEIKKMIDGEDKSKPLSDQRITTLLNKRGYGISRRTVAKYRGTLGIAGISIRKRY